MNNSPAADDHLAALHPPHSIGADMASSPDCTGVWVPPATPALEQDSRTAWCRLYHEARGVMRRLETENERLRAEVASLRAERAATGLEYRGG